MDEAAVPRPSPAMPLMLHLARIDLAAFLRHPLAIFWTLAYPLILFLLMNTIFGQRLASGQGLSHTDYLISGIALMNIVGTCLFSFVLPLIELRAQSKLRLMAAMPVPDLSYFFGFAVSRLLVLGVYSGLFIYALSHLAPHGASLSVGRALSATAYLMAGATVAIGLGLVLAATIQRTGTAYAVTNFLNVPLTFLSDLFLPAALLPGWMQRIVEWSPLYLLVQTSRDVYAGRMPATQQAGWMIAMSIVGVALIVLASRRFRWTPPSNG